MKKCLVWGIGGCLSLIIIGCVMGAVFCSWWVHHPLKLKTTTVDFVIDPGSSPRRVVRVLNEAGIPIWELGFIGLARLTTRDKLIKAGGYQALQGDTPWRILERLVQGDITQRNIVFVEGWTYRQIRQAIAQEQDITQTLTETTDEQLLKRLGSSANSMEGLIFPDTYTFTPGSTDFDLLRRAYQEGQKITHTIWSQRQSHLPLANNYEALILASIIEKETGYGSDRARVSGVFVNRLRAKMPLQTDPTVIYGMGENYRGKLRKMDLQVDTPWNTYIHNGLPPTPIASAGRAALIAAVHPENHRFLYFVARGDGKSEFSENLNGHHQNVARFIFKRERAKQEVNQ